jgi:hypothetical protein
MVDVVRLVLDEKLEHEIVIDSAVVFVFLASPGVRTRSPSPVQPCRRAFVSSSLLTRSSLFPCCRAHKFYLLATAGRAPAPSLLLSQAHWPQLS